LAERRWAEERKGEGGGKSEKARSAAQHDDDDDGGRMPLLSFRALFFLLLKLHGADERGFRYIASESKLESEASSSNGWRTEDDAEPPKGKGCI
jgi:hypothetical protein